jgi:hypothetical protein
MPDALAAQIPAREASTTAHCAVVTPLPRLVVS